MILFGIKEKEKGSLIRLLLEWTVVMEIFQHTINLILNTLKFVCKCPPSSPILSFCDTFGLNSLTI